MLKCLNDYTTFLQKTGILKPSFPLPKTIKPPFESIESYISYISKKIKNQPPKILSAQIIKSFMNNDNHLLHQIPIKLLSLYTRQIRLIKLNKFLTWKNKVKIIKIKNKKIKHRIRNSFNSNNSNNSIINNNKCDGLYKYYDIYSKNQNDRKVIKLIEEGNQCTFVPEINKNYGYYYDNCGNYNSYYGDNNRHYATCNYINNMKIRKSYSFNGNIRNNNKNYDIYNKLISGNNNNNIVITNNNNSNSINNRSLYGGKTVSNFYNINSRNSTRENQVINPTKNNNLVFINTFNNNKSIIALTNPNPSNPNNPTNPEPQYEYDSNKFLKDKIKNKIIIRNLKKKMIKMNNNKAKQIRNAYTTNMNNTYNTNTYDINNQNNNINNNSRSTFRNRSVNYDNHNKFGYSSVVDLNNTCLCFQKNVINGIMAEGKGNEGYTRNVNNNKYGISYINKNMSDCAHMKTGSRYEDNFSISNDDVNSKDHHINRNCYNFRNNSSDKKNINYFYDSASQRVFENREKETNHSSAFSNNNNNNYYFNKYNQSSNKNNNNNNQYNQNNKGNLSNMNKHQGNNSNTNNKDNHLNSHENIYHSNPNLLNTNRNSKRSVFNEKFINKNNSNFLLDLQNSNSTFPKQLTGEEGTNNNDNIINDNINNNYSYKYFNNLNFKKSEQFTIYPVHQQVTHVTLQSMSDDKIFEMANHYVDTHDTQDSFKMGYKGRKKK